MTEPTPPKDRITSESGNGVINLALSIAFCAAIAAVFGTLLYLKLTGK